MGSTRGGEEILLDAWGNLPQIRVELTKVVDGRLAEVVRKRLGPRNNKRGKGCNLVVPEGYNLSCHLKL